MTDRIFVPKDDTREQVAVPDKVIKANKEKISRLCPLRINAKTVIYVTADKCNDAYRESYLKRMEGNKKSDSVPKDMVADRIVYLYEQGMSVKDIAVKLGVSQSVCTKRINKYKKIYEQFK